ncbi:MAG: DNA topoisomerase IB [Ktedonobacterales bacterium]
MPDTATKPHTRQSRMRAPAKSTRPAARLLRLNAFLENDENGDPAAQALAAGLRYTTNTMPGIQRKRVGDEFRYVDPHGEPVSDEHTLNRIRALGIPPAWKDVWICTAPRGHLQATGHDAKGRKQYRYHPQWRAARDETKYARMAAFGAALPSIRKLVAQDVTLPGLPREKALAAIVELLDTTAIRVGNEIYARENESYGLTTLRNEHVAVQGTTIRISFRGKSGKYHEVDVRDRRLARIIRRSQELPGEELFQYVGHDGELHSITSGDVNDYLHTITGQHFTAKDFRTWAGTLCAAQSLAMSEPADSETQAKKQVTQAVKDAALRLGNTPAICRKSYIHPGVIESYLNGSFQQLWRSSVSTTDSGPDDAPLEPPGPALEPDERAILNLLRQLERQAGQQRERQAS